jgi:hypothetical protein
MTAILVDLLPLIVGAALVPVQIIIVLLLLRAPGGVGRAAAFVGGMTVARLVQGLVFGSVVDAATASDGDSQQGVVVPLLLLVLGIVLWAAAVKKYRHEPDPDDDPPAWMARIDAAGPALLFGFGALFISVSAKLWVFTLGALGVIDDATLSPTERAIAFLLYVLLAQSLLLLPIVAAAVAPSRVGSVLEHASQWLKRNNRPITIAVSAIFGTFFLWKGISGLLL